MGPWLGCRLGRGCWRGCRGGCCFNFTLASVKFPLSPLLRSHLVCRFPKQMFKCRHVPTWLFLSFLSIVIRQSLSTLHQHVKQQPQIKEKVIFSIHSFEASCSLLSMSIHTEEGAWCSKTVFQEYEEPVYSYSTYPDRRFSSSTSQHFKNVPSIRQ